MARLPSTTAHLRVLQQSFSEQMVEGEVAAGGFRWEFRWHFDRGELVVEPSLGRALIQDALLRFLVKSDYTLEAGGDYCFTVRAAFKTRAQVGLKQHQGRQIIHRPGRQPQTAGSSRCQPRAGKLPVALTRCQCAARLRLQHHRNGRLQLSQGLVRHGPLAVPSPSTTPCKGAWCCQCCNQSQASLGEQLSRSTSSVPLASVRTSPHFWRPGSSAAQRRS